MEEDEEIIDIGQDEEQETDIPTVFNDETMLIDHEMDSESRQLIEQMLAEEELYYGKSSIAKPKGTFPKKKKGLSSASLPSHKTRWSKEEDDKLLEALEKFGYGNWKSIAEFLGTRNRLQCKNHARHLLLAEKIKVPEKLKKEVNDFKDVKNNTEIVNNTKEESTNILEQVNITKESKVNGADSSIEADKITVEKEDHVKEEHVKNKEDDFEKTDKTITEQMKNADEKENEEKKEIPILENDTTQVVDVIPKEETQKMDIKPNAEKINDVETTVNYDDGFLDIGDTGAEKNTPENISELEEDIEMAEPKTIDNKTALNKKDKTNDTEAKVESETLIKEKSIKDDSPAPTIPNKNEMFNRFYVSEEEKMENPEWFKQKYSKTPDRYLKIRNHILDCWDQCRPRYLTKTQGRRGLKDCGDVNAIGRVHSYLESMGAINVDCVTSAPRPPKRLPREMLVDDEEIFDASEFVVNYDGPRKRKVRNDRGDWVDPKELEGRVIEHGLPIIENEQKSKRTKRSFHQHYYTGDDFNRGYDPFRLVPTSYYDDVVLPPFEVEISNDALLVMDFHSHLAHTEIIGLLGGNFIKRSGSKVLQVKSVFPCKSTSTGIQCEMDPESEMRAREVFAEQGFNVVGWYHSHPTFEPHPSIRDIENQTSYQTLFREEDTGDEPFVGVIVTPYNAEIHSNHSQFQYLHISKQWDESHSYRVPFSCKRKVEQCEQLPLSVMDQLKGLIQEYKDYEHKVNMILSFGPYSRLEKLLDSLRSHLFMKEEQETQFLDQVKDLVEKEFMND